MTRRKAPAKSVPAGLFECLSPQEAVEVSKQLLVQGLYGARHTNSDGALGYAPDFPGEYADADYAVGGFMRTCSPAARKEDRKSLAATLAECAPEWAEGLERATDQAARK